MSNEASELWQKVLDALSGRVSEHVMGKMLRPLEALDMGDGVLLLRAPNDLIREWVTGAYTKVIEEQLKISTGTPWTIHWTASANVFSNAIPKLSAPPPPPAPKPAPRPAGRQGLQLNVQGLPAAPPPAPVARPRPATSAPKAAPANPPPRTLQASQAARTATVTSNPGAASGAISCGLSPKYTFEQFVIGPSNQMAHAMAQAVADLSGRRVNVLFLCGGTGLGKTHLSNAVGHRVLEQRPNARIMYVSAETFTNEYIDCIRNKRMDEFRARYRDGCDALLMDDVQFIAGKEGTQEEFFHTFNTLYQRDAPIVLTSDVLPQKLEGMAERLLSRFASGLVAEIYPPETETRVAILRKKAEQQKVRLDDEAAFAIASAVSSNVRELEGTFMKMAVQAGQDFPTDPHVDMVLVRRLMRGVGTRPRVVTVEDVQRAVCDYYRIKLAQLTGKDRHKEVALPRQVAMFLARVHLGTSFPQIGAKFDGKDHTTVMAAVRKVDKLLTEDEDVRVAVETLSIKLGFEVPAGKGGGSLTEGAAS